MRKSAEIHEDLDRHDAIKPSSDRNFGLVFAAFFALLAVMSWWAGGHRWPWWLGAALVLSAIAAIRPALLAPAQRPLGQAGVAVVQHRQPGRVGVDLHHHDRSDRPLHARAGTRSSAAQTRSSRRQLLDRASAAWTRAANHVRPVLEFRMLDLLGQLWKFLRVRKKFWLLPDPVRDGAVRGTDRSDQGISGRAVHLHAVLRHAHPRYLRVLPRQRGGAGGGRPHRRGGPGRTLHAQKARCRLSRARRSTIALPRAARDCAISTASSSTTSRC